MKSREFGGYLPFELDLKKEYYNEKEGYRIKRLNSGRSAILFSLEQLDATKVYLPKFYCPTVIDAIQHAGYEIVFYKIDKHLNPVLVEKLSPSDTLILVDYYGIKEKDIKQNFINYSCNIILDFAHDFFAKPILCDNVYNIYSCRKFFGVSDGAYAIAKSFMKNIQLKKEYSFNRSNHLLKSIECLTSEAYDLSIENEKYVGTTYNEMSVLTQQILRTINYKRIENVRQENFKQLHFLLSRYNNLSINENELPAYCYPLLLDIDIRQKLINNKIWVPTMWRELIIDSMINTIEYDYSVNMHCIPIDQRYTRDDMIYLANIIINLIKGECNGKN